MDEVPIPFEFFDGCTYHLKGEHTITGSVSNTSWSKRQATLVLCIFADGVARVKPKLIFHGVPGGKIWREEHQFWDPRVTVELSESAYNNEQLLTKWMEQELFESLPDSDSLLVMDSASFHKTDDVKKLLRDRGITLAIIPPGCTGLLQPLDVAVNKAFKALLREKLESVLEAEEEGLLQGRAAISARRIAVTKAVGDAWDELCDKKVELLQQSFVHTGIAIPPWASCDNLIRIKDVAADQIDFTGWESATEALMGSTAATALPKVEASDDGFSWSLADDEGEVLGRQKHLYELQTVKTLHQLCRQLNLRGTSQLNKAGLIQALLKAEVTGRSASNPVLLDGLENEVPAPKIAGQRSWEVEYSRVAAAEALEERKESGEFCGLLGR